MKENINMKTCAHTQLKLIHLLIIVCIWSKTGQKNTFTIYDLVRNLVKY